MRPPITPLSIWIDPQNNREVGAVRRFERLKRQSMRRMERAREKLFQELNGHLERIDPQLAGDQEAATPERIVIQ